MSWQPSPWPLLTAPAEVQATVALALPPGDRLALSRTHPALREAAGEQGWFEGETVKVATSFSTLQELETLATWARRNRAQLSVAVDGVSAGQPLAALHGARVVTFNMTNCKPPPVDALSGFSEPRSLSVFNCGLRAVPPALSGFTALERLDLGYNWQLGQEGGGLEPLAALAGLRNLRLRICGLHAVPPALTGLTALEDLDLTSNQLGEEDGGLEQLSVLARLRKLSLGHCGLRAVPPALSCLTALEDLNLADNEQLGEEGGGLEPLAALMRLSILGLEGCSLRALPPTVARLTALEELYLGDNTQLQAGLEHLAVLTQLRRLDLQECGLRAIPPALERLVALERLNLRGNSQLGEGDNSLEHLRPLAALQLVCLPDHLTAVLPGLQAALPGAECTTNPRAFHR